MRRVIPFLLLSTATVGLIACGNLAAETSAKESDEGAFHLSITGCGASGETKEFDSQEKYCSWAKSEAGKACLKETETPGVESPLSELCG